MVTLSLERDADGWELLLRPSEVTLSVSLALKIHLLQPHTTGSAPSFFNEEVAPLSADKSFWDMDYPDVCVGSLFTTVVQLTHAFQAAEDTVILLHALMLSEALTRQQPGILCAKSVRPILLAAFTLSSKMYYDEVQTGIVDALRAVGFDLLTTVHLYELERELCEALDHQLLIGRQDYSNYVFELRALATANMPQLETSLPAVVRYARGLDGPVAAPPQQQEDRRQPPAQMQGAALEQQRSGSVISTAGKTTPTDKNSPSFLARRRLVNAAPAANMWGASTRMRA